MSEQYELNRKSSVTNKTQQKSRSNRKGLKSLCKWLFIILCTSGLLWNTWELFGDYFAGRSVVNIEYETIKYNKIPAITICYIRIVLLNALVKKHPQFKGKYDNYTEELKGLLKKKGDSFTVKDLPDQFRDGYYSIVEDYVPYYSPRANEFFNVSIPYTESIIEQVYLQGTQLLKNGTFKSIVLHDYKPIESIIFNMESPAKCYTFFSHINEEWRHYQVNVKTIRVHVRPPYDWFPVGPNDLSIRFSLHSPDELPTHNLDNFKELKIDRNYLITYNRWKTKIEQPLFRTVCKVYNLDDKESKNRMRSNCLKHCIKKKLLDCAPCDLVQYPVCLQDCIVDSTTLWTEEDYSDNKNISLCHQDLKDEFEECLIDDLPMFESECQIECPVKCTDRHYKYEVNKIVSYRDDDNDRIRSTMIEVMQNSAPDQITTHMPEMTLIQFVSGFGGLLGMWLGLSALALLEFSVKYFKID